MQNPALESVRRGLTPFSEKVWHSLGLSAFIIIVFGPFLALAVSSAKSILVGNNSEWLILILPSARTLKLLIESVVFAGSVSLAGMAFGVMVAIFLWRWQSRAGTYLRWLVVLLFPIPAYVHTLAWLTATAGASAWMKTRGLIFAPLEGWVGSWWIQVITLLPLAIALSLVGLSCVSQVLIDASRLLRSGLETLIKVVLPLAAPAIIAGAGFLFVLSITEYSVPSLFSKNVYALEIFAEYSTNSIPAKAFLLSIPLLFISGAVIIFSQSAIRNATLHIGRQTPNLKSLILPRWFSWLQMLCVAVVLSGLLVPLVSLLVSVGSFKQIFSSVASASSEIILSFLVALAAAVLCLPIAWAAARELVSSKRRSFFWWLIVIFPLAIPASLVGIGLISMYNKAALGSFYSSAWMLVLANLARFSSFAALILMAQLRRIDRAQLDAASLYQKNNFQNWLKVKLPLFSPGIFAASFIVFALSLGELGATLIIAPPGKATLTMRIYNFMHYGASHEVAGLCFVIALMVILSGGLAISIFSKERQR